MGGERIVLLLSILWLLTSSNKPHHKRDDDDGEPRSIKQGREGVRDAVVMTATEGYPIEYEKGDKNQDVSHPSVRQPEKSAEDDLCEQDSPDTTHQRMFVEQKEPEQERRYEAKTVEPLNIC